MELVWFKRDLRVGDHAPLVEAARRGPIVALYLYEPSVMGAPDFSFRHLTFINESLVELETALAARGGRLVTRIGEAVGVFDEIHRASPVTRIWSHEETGNGATYARDRAVAAWAKAHGVEWREIPQHGVVRRLASRDGWARHWQRFMARPPLPAPEALADAAPALGSEGIVVPAFVTAGRTLKNEQRGGERAGQEMLRTFLAGRGRDYRRGMSSPVTAWDACSRISPHLAYGNLSMRSVHHAAERRRRTLMPSEQPFRASLEAFSSRLSWHCHFIQKLEDEPRIEFENMHRSFDGLREDDFDPEKFEAWREGRTGYPMVDACMRALTATGWLNFRMRAMLMSFAAYHLWLHWREPALHLARLFTDYEPGIHYSQVQMQSGTTGINSLRIYSPAKQVVDHDPEGVFIRRWVPELAAVPDDFLAEPHRLEPAHQRAIGCRIGIDYPAPIVDHGRAYRAARTRMERVRRTPEARRTARDVVRRHGSRKAPMRRF